MARDTQNTNDDWRGSWVEVKHVSLVPHNDNLHESKSNHAFERYSKIVLSMAVTDRIMLLPFIGSI